MIKDETELFNKGQTRDSDLAYLNDLNSVMTEPGRSPDLDVILTNLTTNFNLGAPLRLEYLVQDANYWDNYFSHCSNRYIQSCNRQQK